MAQLWARSDPAAAQSRPALAGESWAPSREKIPPRLQNAKTGSTSYARGELYISEYNRHYTLQYNLHLNFEVVLNCSYALFFIVSILTSAVTTNNPFISMEKVRILTSPKS